jgi:hypothetical protein
VGETDGQLWVSRDYLGRYVARSLKKIIEILSYSSQARKVLVNLLATRLLVKSDWRPHGCLNEQRLDILPILLQERNQEVNRHHDIRQ